MRRWLDTRSISGQVHSTPSRTGSCWVDMSQNKELLSRVFAVFGPSVRSPSVPLRMISKMPTACFHLNTDKPGPQPRRRYEMSCPSGLFL